MKCILVSEYSVRSGLVVLLIPLVASICWAHDRSVVHPGLTTEAMAALSSGFYTPDYGALVRQGSIDEDNGVRWREHGYNPKTGQGWGLPFTGPAIARAQDLWQQAIDEYNNGNLGDVDGAFHILGSVVHILEDMTSPAHVHTDIHIEFLDAEDFETWGLENFADYDFADLIPSFPPDRSAIGGDNGFIHSAATFTYNVSAFQGELVEVAGTQPDSDLNQMFPSLHYYDGGILGDNYWEIDNIGTFEKALEFDDWWPCEQDYTDDHSGPGGVRRIRGEFYIENSGGDDGNLTPVVYEGSSNTKTLLQIYGDILYPECIRYVAGLLQVFIETVEGGDSFEPDNVWTQAKEQLPNTSSSVHSIDPAGDEDWTYFTLPSLSKVIIEARGPSGDAQMWLYDSSLQQLAYDDDDGTGLFPKIVELLLPGTYYVKVGEYGNNDIIPEYYIDLTATACEHPCIAVTDPYYDDIGAILASMGYEYIEIQDEDIADYDYIRYFDVIFINCSRDCSDNAPAAQNSLEQFVREGGYVYASDWAFIYVETSFPGHIFFPEYPYIGDTGYVQANVVDMGLAEYLGKSTMQIHFDLSSWVVIQDIAPDVSVYLRGTVEAGTDTAQTSLSLSELVHPPTSREPSSTIQSSETMATIPDMPLCMSFEYGEGRVLFTTFHNEPQVSEDERKLLEYLVLIPYTGSLSDELASAMEDSGYDVDKENLGTINQGEVSGAYKYSNVKVQNLAFGANWAGSTMKLSVYEPGGNLYEEEQSDQPPLVIRVQQAEVGEWSYSITAVDIPYDNYPYVLQVGSSEGIPLAIGWNLISLPLQPPNTNPDAVLSSIAGLYNSVWAYEPNEGWSIYAPDAPSDLQEIVSGKGYWVKMNEPGTLDIQGTIPESTEVLLKGAKWNLVGYCSLNTKDVEDCNLPNCISSVWDYNANIGWSIYAPGWLTDLEAMKPGCGYWMKVRENHPEDCVWDVNQPITLAAPPLTMRTRDDYVSEDRPEMPYMVWGSVEIDGEKITGDSTVILKVDGKIQSSYTLGTVEGYGDSYVLSIPAVIGSYSQAELYIQIDGNQIKSAIVPPGRPGDIIRFDLPIRTPPKVSRLHQNYPNPFNPDTWIPYQLSEDAHIVIKIYAATGQLVRILNLGYKPAGFYTDKAKAAYWDGKNEAGEHVASGTYFCTIQAGDFTATKKMVITR